MAGQKTRRRRVPQRTCVACRHVQGKRTLIRVVRTPAGGVQIDPTGKQAGRGAYLCPARSCWDIALTQGRLGQALKIRLNADDQRTLADYAQTLPEMDDLGSEELERVDRNGLQVSP